LAIKRQADLLRQQVEDARTASDKTLAAINEQAMRMKEQVERMDTQVADARASSAASALTAASTLAAIERQGCLMERQAIIAEQSVAAARDNATAALLNARALITSERPWILVSIQRSEPGSDAWIVQGRNAGNTPAKILEGHCFYAKHQTLFTGPTEPICAPFWAPIQTLIVTTDSFEILRINPETLITQDDRDGFACAPNLFIYGWISYWDTFTDRTTAGPGPSRTSWLFRYDSSTKKFCRCAGDYANNT
jgi:hypothetical protein